MSAYYLRGHMEVQTADWTRTRGRIAEITVGAFGFGVSTADGCSIGFEIRVGRWMFGWSFLRDADR